MSNQGRDAKREVFWRGVRKRYAASGLTIRAFCQREQFTESAFFAWRRTIAERDVEAKLAKQPAFLPVVVDGDSRREGEITIELAGGRVLRLPEATPTGRMVELVNALEARVEQ